MLSPGNVAFALMLATSTFALQPPQVYPSFIIKAELSIELEAGVVPNTVPVTIAKSLDIISVNLPLADYTLIAPLDDIRSSYITSWWAATTLNNQTFNCTFIPPCGGLLKPRYDMSYGSYWATYAFSKTARNMWIFGGVTHNSKGEESGVTWVAQPNPGTKLTILFDKQNIRPRNILVEISGLGWTYYSAKWNYRVVSFEVDKRKAALLTTLTFNKSQCTLDPNAAKDLPPGCNATNPDISAKAAQALARKTPSGQNNSYLPGWQTAADFYSYLGNGGATYVSAHPNMTWREQIELLFPHASVDYVPGPLSAGNFPEGFSLDKYNLYPTVKNQRQCNMCYAVSTVTAIEIAYYVAIYLAKNLLNRTLGVPHLSYPLLSPQFAMDCTPQPPGAAQTGGLQGCNTGFASFVHEFIASTGGGVPLTADVPYNGVSGRCKPSVPSFNTTMISYSFVQNVNQMRDAIVNHGAVTASVNMVPFGNWQTSYAYQAFEGCYNQSTSSNHVVTIVGWSVCTRSNGSKMWCWKAMNSFGDRWGYYGYVLLPMDPAGDCGVFGSDSPDPSMAVANWIKRVVPIIKF